MRVRGTVDVLPVKVLMLDGDEARRNELLLTMRADLAHTAER
jgi:hypothetical protein